MKMMNSIYSIGNRTRDPRRLVQPAAPPPTRIYTRSQFTQAHKHYDFFSIEILYGENSCDMHFITTLLKHA